MEMPEIILTAVLAGLMLVMCIFYAKSRRRFVRLLFGALSGVALLFPAQLILAAMGHAIALNLFTVSVAAILGIPGVLLLCAALLV